MTTATAPAGVLELIDPQSIDVATNVRTEVEATLTTGFLDSVTANGVLVPIVATRDENGVHVRYGQRRTLAAQQVGLSSVPVYIVEANEADDAQRIIEQLVENDQRQDLTDGDRIQAWKALELEGLSATAIAKRTGTKRDKIKTGLTVAASDTGTRLIAEVGMTLDQAALLIEFEDAPETVAALTKVATDEPGYFPHAVQRARDDRAAAEARESGEQVEATKGHRILSEAPAWDARTPYRLGSLRTSEGERVSAEEIQGKEGVAVYVRGHRDGTSQVTYYVDDPEAIGYSIADDGMARKGGPMTDEEKAERKQLIANNKDWDAAESVRREWLAQFLSRKTLPKDSAQVIARCLTEARHLVAGEMSGNALAADLLSVEPVSGYYGDRFADFLAAHPAKAGHVTLAIVLGGIEASTGRDTWRHPREETAHYLQTLTSWGYTLSPVEQIAAMIEPTENE
ncbi:Chromosome (plasmid) partitioning protein ParB [Microbacterium esteraromaticum]|uniref:Chromosome (Plasmid) partitioning protein ParB n=1 Tax=Microbacterium esteraromaticum TaxID=57043 RepID=A0A1R4IZA7_9MICO|nr:ParB N-terminal domain-containing protein [Microbacterium esteraromaticum]SJN25211.1 Chromosome (plasmid) partitioning protein ParB [Microbacterium esteraromaticum]